MIKRVAHWYFGKNVLPYWVILLMDMTIVFASAVITYWISKRTMVTIDNRWAVVCTAGLYALLSLVGAKMFRTYAGVLRYSNTMDLVKLSYANGVSLALILVCSLILRWTGVACLSALSPLETVVTFVIATSLMWASRLAVKMLYSASKAEVSATRVLIYGALTGGVGMAKYIRSQTPVRFELAGFISHEHRIKGMKLLDVNVYSLEDDIAEVIRKEKIKAVLVSPARANDFRKNQKIQDVIIGEGCKIYMAQEATEASVRNGELAEKDIQLHEVSVEDLLPRQEIKVDLKAVEELLSGMRVSL